MGVNVFSDNFLSMGMLYVNLADTLPKDLDPLTYLPILHAK